MDLDDDDVDEDEEAAEVAPESEWVGKRRRKRKGAARHPVDEEFLAIVRQARIKEVEMWWGENYALL